jgi:hypothetical protein
LSLVSCYALAIADVTEGSVLCGNQARESRWSSGKDVALVNGDSTAAVRAHSTEADVVSSAVQQLFGATCRSTVVCPGCQQQSEKMEPYLSVSLPIEVQPRRVESHPVGVQSSQQTIYVTAVRRLFDGNAARAMRPVRYGLEADPDKTTVYQLKKLLGHRCGIAPAQVKTCCAICLLLLRTLRDDGSSLNPTVFCWLDSTCQPFISVLQQLVFLS